MVKSQISFGQVFRYAIDDMPNKFTKGIAHNVVRSLYLNLHDIAISYFDTECGEMYVAGAKPSEAIKTWATKYANCHTDACNDMFAFDRNQSHRNESDLGVFIKTLLFVSDEEYLAIDDYFLDHETLVADDPPEIKEFPMTSENIIKTLYEDYKSYFTKQHGRILVKTHPILKHDLSTLLEIVKTDQAG